MSTVNEQVQKIRRVLLGAHRPMLNRLDGGLDTSVTTVVLEFAATGVARGSYISVNDEMMYVWSVSDKTLTVQREMLGTTAGTHADGDVVEIDPRFPDGLILDEMSAEITSWPRSIFAVDTDDLSLGAGDTMSAFAPTGIYSVLAVNRQPVNSTDDRWPEIGFDYKRSLGKLFIDTTGSSNQSFTVTVTYSKAFDTDPFTGATDLQTDVGLSAALEDALKYGTCWRLLVGREVKRTFTESQGEPRNAEEVPPGHANSVADGFLKLRNTRISEEARRLAADYPWRGYR